MTRVAVKGFQTRRATFHHLNPAQMHLNHQIKHLYNKLCLCIEHTQHVVYAIQMIKVKPGHHSTSALTNKHASSNINL